MLSKIAFFSPASRETENCKSFGSVFFAPTRVALTDSDALSFGQPSIRCHCLPCFASFFATRLIHLTRWLQCTLYGCVCVLSLYCHHYEYNGLFPLRLSYEMRRRMTGMGDGKGERGGYWRPARRRQLCC